MTSYAGSLLEDQRSFPRKQVPVQALLRTDRSAFRFCCVRDLSLAGAYLEMDVASADTALAPGMTLETVLGLRWRDRVSDHRLSGEIVRVEPSGLAIRFQSYADSVYTALVGTLYC